MLKWLSLKRTLRTYLKGSLKIQNFLLWGVDWVICDLGLFCCCFFGRLSDLEHLKHQGFSLEVGSRRMPVCNKLKKNPTQQSCTMAPLRSVPSGCFVPELDPSQSIFLPSCTASSDSKRWSLGLCCYDTLLFFQLQQKRKVQWEVFCFTHCCCCVQTKQSDCKVLLPLFLLLSVVRNVAVPD